MPVIKIVQHPVKVGDNTIITGKSGEPNSETVLLGAEQVIVGVKSGEKVIKTDPETGLNYETDEIIAQEIYSLAEKSHNPWFVLDLETGSRGWYPGKKEEADDTAEQSQSN